MPMLSAFAIFSSSCSADAVYIVIDGASVSLRPPQSTTLCNLKPGVTAHVKNHYMRDAWDVNAFKTGIPDCANYNTAI